ncbi:MAG: matrixin family metalloprotease [Kofleriaceae bacterium]
MRSLLILAMLAGVAHAAPDLEALGKPVPACEATRTCFGIALHVTVVDGKSIATPAWVAIQFAAANHHFARLGVGFQIASIDALPAGAARVRDIGDRNAFRPQVTGTVIHVFVTGQLDDIDRAGEVIRGVTWRRDATTKFVIVSTIAFDRVLAHELGHVFGLPHSTYAISIMNKTERAVPPPESRTFADEEYAAMKPKLAQLLRDRLLVPVKAP